MPRPTISVDIQARDRTRQTIANFQGQIAGLTRTFGGLTRIVGPLAGAAGIGGIATAATQAVSAVAELNLQAERLDIWLLTKAMQNSFSKLNRRGYWH